MAKPPPMKPMFELTHQTQILWLGRVSYSAALELQHLAAAVAAHPKSGGFIFGLEHDPVITLGKRALNDDVFSSPPGFEIIRSDRGGEVTLHTPGQLVVYPVLPLKRWDMGVKEYVESLHAAMISTCKDFGLMSFKHELPGVYTETGKIGFVGVRVANGISLHGLSLNVQNDLSLFDLIKPCGVQNQRMTRIADHKDDVTVRGAFERLAEHLKGLISR